VLQLVVAQRKPCTRCLFLRYLPLLLQPRVVIHRLTGLILYWPAGGGVGGVAPGATDNYGGSGVGDGGPLFETPI